MSSFRGKVLLRIKRPSCSRQEHCADEKFQPSCSRESSSEVFAHYLWENGAFSVSQMSHNARNVTAIPPEMDEEKMINKIDVKAF